MTEYQFRRTPEGLWQRRQPGGAWLTLSVRWIHSRNGAAQPRQPRWDWK